VCAAVRNLAIAKLLLTRLLTSGEEDFRAKGGHFEYSCKLTMLISSISVTCSVTCYLASNVGQYILVHFTAYLGFDGRFSVHLVAVNFCLQQ